MKNKILLVSFLTSLVLIVNGQDESILNEFNNYYNTVKDESPTKDSGTSVKDTVEIVFDGSIPLDSLELLAAADVIEVEEIDSSLYKGEILFPEQQIPVKLYTHEKDWEKEFLITNRVTYKKHHVLDTNFVVFGWHPYWMGTAYESYNFSLLSMVAYFSYEVDPATGGYKTVHNWKTTPLVDSVHAHGNKVLLAVTNFGKENNKRFLNNVKAQKNLIRNVITLLKERNADGVNIDFEGIRAKDKEELNNFLIDLTSSLKTENGDYIVTVAVPAFDFNTVYDIASIGSYIDYFIIMGYEFHGSKSKTAGPVAPLTSGNRWMPLNIERSVDEYLVAGADPKKLILSLAYYGIEWQTYDLKFPSKAKKFEEYHTYRNVKKIIRDNSCVIDEPSLSKYYAYRDTKNNYRQIWFDDSTTLGLKYDWIKDKDIGGLGIWALGYDNGHSELWQLLAKKFAYSDKELLAQKRKGFRMTLRRSLYLVHRLIRNPRSLLTRPRPVMMLFGGLFGLSMAGFLLLFRYGHRFGRMFNIAMKGTVSLILIVGFAVVFILLRFVKVNEVFYLLGGIIFGLFLFYLFSRRFLSEKELP